MGYNKRQYIIAAIILIIALTFGITLGAVTWIIRDTPDITNYKGSIEATMIYGAEGEPLTRLYKENRIYVPLERIPSKLKNAVIAIEDKNFYVHHGIDFWGIARAFWINIKQGRLAQGGSTITQQLARNALLTQRKSFYRKIQEAYLALQFERLYTKPEILEMYLNEIFLGHSAYGIETAANQYFDKSVWELDLSEAALLAGLPKAPNYYSPFNNPEHARNRRDVVLNKMEDLGYITEKETEQAKDKELDLRSSIPDKKETAPYFVRYIRNRLVDRFGSQMVYNGGLKVYTTLNKDMQDKAEESIQQALEEGYIPTVERDNTADPRQPQLSIISLDPKTGAIRAMVGGRGNDHFNRATQAVRQPGSAFKPFVYTDAIKNGYSAARVINDMPMRSPKDNTSRRIWPTNSQDKYRGYVSLRDALTHSINVASVKLLQEVGVESTIETAKQMGISTFENADYEPDHLSLALGGLNRGVTLLEMASAYGVFANRGIRIEPFAITKILDNRDQTIYEASPRKEVVLEEDTSYIMTSMLQSVIESGTGWRAQLDRPVAGKTGTTNDYSDAWFVGYTPDLVTAAWIGEDNLQKMIYDQKDDQGNYLFPENNGPRTISSSEAARLWGEYMKNVMEDEPKTDFTVPANIVRRDIDPVTGLLANSYTPKVRKEIFRKNNVPTKREDLHGPIETVKIDRESGELATSNCPEDQIVEYNYIAKNEIRVGPAEIQFSEQNPGSYQRTRGTYLVNTGEPVQKIDSELGIPLTNNNGEVQYQTKPSKSCHLHPGKKNVIEDLWDYFKPKD
ncbi:MAG: penicillin-binding protein 1A [Bacillota bacterium]